MDLFNKDTSLVTLEYAQNESGILATDILFMLTATRNLDYPGEKVNYIEKDGVKFFTASEVTLLKRKYEDFNLWYESVRDEKGREKSTRLSEHDEDEVLFDRTIEYDDKYREDNDEETDKEVINEEESFENNEDFLDDFIEEEKGKKKKKSKPKKSNLKRLEEIDNNSKKLQEEKRLLENRVQEEKSREKIKEYEQKLKEINVSLDKMTQESQRIAESSRFVGEKEKTFFNNQVEKFNSLTNREKEIEKEIGVLVSEIKEELAKQTTDVNNRFNESTKTLSDACGVEYKDTGYKPSSIDKVENTINNVVIKDVNIDYDKVLTADNIKVDRPVNALKTSNIDEESLTKGVNADEAYAVVEKHSYVETYSPTQEKPQDTVPVIEPKHVDTPPVENTKTDKYDTREVIHETKVQKTINEHLHSNDTPIVTETGEKYDIKRPAYVKESSETVEKYSYDGGTHHESIVESDKYNVATKPFVSPITNIKTETKELFSFENNEAFSKNSQELQDKLGQLVNLTKELNSVSFEKIEVAQVVSKFSEELSIAKGEPVNESERKIKDANFAVSVSNNTERFCTGALAFAAGAENILNENKFKNSIAENTYTMADAIVGINASETLTHDEKVQQITNCVVNLSTRVADASTEYGKTCGDVFNVDGQRIVTAQSFIDNHIVSSNQSRVAIYGASNGYYNELVAKAVAAGESPESIISESATNRNAISYNFENSNNTFVKNVCLNCDFANGYIENINKVQDVILGALPIDSRIEAMSLLSESKVRIIADNVRETSEYVEKILNNHVNESSMFGDGKNLSVEDSLMINIAKSNNILVSENLRINSLVDSLIKERDNFTNIINSDTRLSADEKTKILSDFNKTVKGVLADNLNRAEEVSFFTRKEILNNTYAIQRLEFDGDLTPEQRVKLANLDEKYQSDLTKLTAGYSKNIEGLDERIQTLLGTGSNNRPVKVIANGEMLEEFDSDSVTNDANQKPLSSVAPNIKNAPINTDSMLNGDAPDETSLSDAENQETQVTKQIGAASGEALHAAQADTLVAAYDYNWYGINNTIEKFGKMTMSTTGRAVRGLFRGTEVQSGFATFAPVVGVPVNAIVNLSLRYTIESMTRDSLENALARFGSASNMMALQKLVNARGMNIDVTKLRMADIDKLFAGTEIIGKGKLSNLSPKQLMMLLKSKDTSPALKAAISAILHDRKILTLKKTLGRRKMNTRRYGRRFAGVFVDGTAAGEGYEDLRRYYRYARQAFSTQYKIVRFLGRNAMKYLDWRRGRKAVKLQNKINKGKRVAKNTEKLAKLSRKTTRIAKRRGFVSNKLNAVKQLREKYSLDSLKRKLLVKAYDAFMKKYGATKIGQLIAKLASAAGKIATFASNLMTWGIWAILILILIYLILLLLSAIGSFILIPLESASQLFDGGDPFIVQGYHRLHLNEAGQDTLNDLWYQAITEEVANAKKPDNTTGYKNPANGKNYTITEYGGGDLGVKGYSSFYASDGYELELAGDAAYSISNARTILALADLKLRYCATGESDTSISPGIDWSARKYNDYIAALFEETHRTLTRDSELMSCYSGCETYTWYCNDNTCDDYLAGTNIVSGPTPAYKHDGTSCKTPPGGWQYCSGCLKHTSNITGQEFKYCPGCKKSSGNGKIELIPEKLKSITASYDAKFTTYDTTNTYYSIYNTYKHYLYIDSTGQLNIVNGKYLEKDVDCDCDGKLDVDYNVIVSQDGLIQLVYMNDTWVLSLNNLDLYLYHPYGDSKIKCNVAENYEELRTYSATVDIKSGSTGLNVKVRLPILIPEKTKSTCTHTVTETFMGQYYSYCEGHTSKPCKGHRLLYVKGIVSFARDNINSPENTKYYYSGAGKGYDNFNMYIKIYNEIESTYWDNKNKMDWFKTDDNGDYIYVELLRQKLTINCDQCGSPVIESAHCYNCGDLIDNCPRCGSTAINNYCWNAFCSNFNKQTMSSRHFIKNNTFAEMGYPDLQVNPPYVSSNRHAFTATEIADAVTCRVSGSYTTGYTMYLDSFWEKIDSFFEKAFAE